MKVLNQNEEIVGNENGMKKGFSFASCLTSLKNIKAVKFLKLYVLGLHSNTFDAILWSQFDNYYTNE